MQVELVQGVIDGVNLLIEMEKRLESRQEIDDLLPEVIPEEELKRSKLLLEISDHQHKVEEYHVHLNR